MLIIWGWRNRASIIARGIFLCPHCGADRAYAHKRMRRWFTVFFIPLIPLKQLGELVQCETCKQMYKPAVLTAPTSATLEATLVNALREAVVAIVRVVGTTGARAAGLAELSSLAGRAWSDEELAADVVNLDLSELPAHLAMLSTTLNEHGKERLLSACVRVAATGGVLDSDGRAIVERVAADLTMTPAHARGVIDSVVEASRA